MTPFVHWENIMDRVEPPRFAGGTANGVGDGGDPALNAAAAPRGGTVVVVPSLQLTVQYIPYSTSYTY